MADLSRMTAFRRVRRTVQDVNVILSAGEGSLCLAEKSGAPFMSECELSPGGSTSCSAVEVAPESCVLSCQPACAAGCLSSDGHPAAQGRPVSLILNRSRRLATSHSPLNRALFFQKYGIQKKKKLFHSVGLFPKCYLCTVYQHTVHSYFF